jgi:predicted transcriptional regulator of viral defense system
MLRNPELCGGINHVIDVFEEHGSKYLRLITDDIDQNGAPIDKVRAGYILDELMGIDSEVVESWISFAQRGGSRKLDSSSEYIEDWSDRWQVSLNVFRSKPHE